MQYPAKSLFRMVRVTADAEIGTPATAKHLWGVLVVAAAAAATLDLTNSTDGTGTPLLDVNAPAGGSSYVNLFNLGGIPFTTSMYADIGGAAAIAYLWIEE